MRRISRQNNTLYSKRDSQLKGGKSLFRLAIVLIVKTFFYWIRCLVTILGQRENEESNSRLLDSYSYVFRYRWSCSQRDFSQQSHLFKVLSPTSIVQRYNNRLEGYFFIEEKIYRREWHDPEKVYNISKALTGHNSLNRRLVVLS